MTGVDIVHLRVVTADDVDLAVVHRRVRGPVATIVVVHGFTAHREHPEIVALVDALGRDDVDIVTYDARGHGCSGGESTLGDRERHDVAAAVGVARTDTPVVLVGVSMGGAAALGYLDERPPGPPEIAGLLLISSPSRWQAKPSLLTAYVTFITRTAPGRMLARRHPGVRIARGLRLPTAPWERIGRVSVPVWIVHGRDDRLLDPVAADELRDAAAGPARLDLVDGMGHALREPGLAAARRGLDWVLAGADDLDGEQATAP